MRIYFLFIFCLAAASCNLQLSVNKKYNATVERETISGYMMEQQEAWNRGDIESFMGHYWNNDSLTFIGSKGLTKGWKSTLDNYKRAYPGKDAMGKLTFTNYKIDVIDEKSAYVIGKWNLDRSSDTLNGHYTLLWKKIGGKWTIVADHSS